MKKCLAFAMIFLSIAFLCAAMAQEAKIENKEKPMIDNLPDLAPGTYVLFDTTMGRIIARLFTEQAPKTTAVFIGLVEGTKPWKDQNTGQTVQRPFYDGLIFHRVIPDFMIQGGCPLGMGYGGPGFKFDDEFHPKLRHDKPGILSMANSGPNTNGSQFFITERPTPHLDNLHTIFGEVVDGMDVVKKIARVERGAKDKPLTPVVMKKVSIVRIGDKKAAGTASSDQPTTGGGPRRPAATPETAY